MNTWYIVAKQNIILAIYSETAESYIHCFFRIFKLLLLSAVATDCIVFIGVFFCFSVSTITREPLHSAWWNFACTCSRVPRQPLEPIEFQGHRSKVKVTWLFCVFVCAWCCGYPRTVLSREPGFVILFWRIFTLVYSVFRTWMRLQGILGRALRRRDNITIQLFWIALDFRSFLFYFAQFKNPPSRGGGRQNIGCKTWRNSESLNTKIYNST